MLIPVSPSRYSLRLQSSSWTLTSFTGSGGECEQLHVLHSMVSPTLSNLAILFTTSIHCTPFQEDPTFPTATTRSQLIDCFLRRRAEVFKLPPLPLSSPRPPLYPPPRSCTSTNQRGGRPDIVCTPRCLSDISLSTSPFARFRPPRSPLALFLLSILTQHTHV